MGRGLHGQVEMMSPEYLPGAQRRVKESTATSLPPIMTPRPPPADVKHFSPGPPRGAKRPRPRPGGNPGSKLKYAAAPSLPPVHGPQANGEVTPALLASMQGTGLLYFDSTTKGNKARDASPSPDSAAATTRYPSKAGDTMKSHALASPPLEKGGHTLKLRPKLPEQPQTTLASGSAAGDVLGSSLYGHVWPTADATKTKRVKPSANQADKVYSNPVVPGAPRVRRQRQIKRSVLKRGASPTAWIDGSVREKVLGVLEHALTAESLPAEVKKRIIQSVSNALLVDESDASAAEASAFEDVAQDAQTQDQSMEPDAEQAPIGEDFSTACYNAASLLVQASENGELQKALDEITNEVPAVDIDLHELRAASATPVLSVADQDDEGHAPLLQPRPPASPPLRSRRPGSSRASFADSVPVSFIISTGSVAADDLATAAVAGAAAEAVKDHEVAPSRPSYFSSEVGTLGRFESSAASDRFILDTVYGAVAKAIAAEEAAPSHVSKMSSAVSYVDRDSSAAAFDLALGTVTSAMAGAVGTANEAEIQFRPNSADTGVSVQTVMGATFEEETKDQAVFQMSATVLANVMDWKTADGASDAVDGRAAVSHLSEDVSKLALDSGLEAFLAEMAGDTFEDPEDCVDLDS